MAVASERLRASTPPNPRKAKAWLKALAERDAGGHALPRFQCGARVQTPWRVQGFHGLSARHTHACSLTSRIGRGSIM
jgi:hypothetical protein